jgi:hypothetical protein
MDKFKLLLFKEEFKCDLDYIGISIINSNLVINELLNSLNLDKIDVCQSFFEKVFDKLEDDFVTNKPIDLNLIFNLIHEKSIKFDLTVNLDVYLIWEFDLPVDLINMNILKQYWDFIWFDGSDESMLIFAPDNFIIQICDWGEIKYKIF